MKNMKKLFALALVIVSVLAIAVPAMAATPATNTSGVNVRKTASTQGTLVGQVATGTTLEVLGETIGQNHNGSTLWLHVRVIKCAAGSKHSINGRTGYVHSSYVSGYTTGTSHPQSKDEAFGPSGYIQKGNTGNYVRNVQWVLHWEGFLSSSQVDGIFGSDTEQAVMDYQLKYWYDLTDSEYENVVDGIVGPLTKTSMWNRWKTSLMRYGVK